MNLTGGELCKGCIDFGICVLRPEIINGPTCPCINCLVKMVCQQYCNDWLKFENAYFVIPEEIEKGGV